MKPVPVSGPGPDASLAACLCALLEVDPGETPGAAGAQAWQEWLAARNLRMVDAAELPGSGFWIGVGEDGHHVLMFGSPPDLVWDPAGSDSPPAIRAGIVLAALDPALPAVARSERSLTGTVEAIYVAEVREGACTPLEAAEAVEGRGLRGDRYFHGEGTFSAGTLTGRDLTLIEAEALDALAAEHGVHIEPAEARRNVLTRGIGLNDLVGREFRIGGAHCVGRRWCEPCAHLQRLTVGGTLRGLVHRGGLRADILRTGTIAVGDRIEALD